MNKSYLKYFTALIIFGSNGIVASYIDLTSYEIVLMRTMLGMLFIFVVFIAGKNKFTFYKHKTSFLFLSAAGIATGANWMFLYEAYARIGVSVSSLLYYCGPVIVMALSPLLFKERLTIFKLMGFAAVFCGVFCISGNTVEGKADVFGICCGILSAVMYAFLVIFNKKAPHIEGLENSLIQLFTAFLTVAAFTAIKQGISFDIPHSSIFPVIIIGLLNTGIACYLYNSSIRFLPVQTVAICGYLEPLSAVLFSILFLGEILLPVQIIGIALIIGGAVFSELFRSSHSNAGTI